MSRPAFDALDRDWMLLVQSPAAGEALARWRSDPVLAANDLDQLVGEVWAASKADANRVHAALARRAPTDVLAARVLLHMLRPGLRALGRRLSRGAGFVDVDPDLLGLAWERVRTYPIDRRPAAIAANVLLDVRKRYVRGVLEPVVESFDQLPEHRGPAAPSAEHQALEADVPTLRRAHALLVSAIERGAVTRTSAVVVWRTRVEETGDADVAAELGVGVRTLQRRRQRAERQLGAAC